MQARIQQLSRDDAVEALAVNPSAAGADELATPPRKQREIPTEHLAFRMAPSSDGFQPRRAGEASQASRFWR